MKMSEEMYTEIILDYYKNPKNFGNLDNPEIKFKDLNPSCGDVVEIQVKLEKNKVHDVKFNGKGCAISLASAELLTEHLKGKNIDEIKNLNKEEILELLGINLSEIRLKCALLPLKVFKVGLYNYLGEKDEGQNY